MKCTYCDKNFKSNKDSVKLYYFDKTLYFCNDKCYYDYSKEHHPTYWQWFKKFSKLSINQKNKYYQNLRKVNNQIKYLEKKYQDGNKVLHAKHDLIWTKPVKPSQWFNHISDYNSFIDFKKAVIRFLTKDTLKSIYEDSWNFFCHNSYNPDWQKKQIKAINKVFDELYGINRVRWGFITYDDNHPNKENLFWGPYIVIDEETFILCFPYRYTLDIFIKKRLKNEEIYTKERKEFK